MSRFSTRRLGRFTAFAAVASAFLPLIGCGNTYRPVITAINPVGPAAQPTKYAVAISDPNLGSGGSLPGLVTFVDFSGDTVLITANIGVDPYYLILGGSGTTGLTLNGDGTVNSFGISTALLSSSILQTTLLANPTPTSPLPTSIFPEGSYTYITQPGRSSVAELSGSPPDAPAGALSGGSSADLYSRDCRRSKNLRAQPKRSCEWRWNGDRHRDGNQHTFQHTSGWDQPGLRRDDSRCETGFRHESGLKHRLRCRCAEQSAGYRCDQRNDCRS